jgi:membrane associated rhomboid family serine protease
MGLTITLLIIIFTGIISYQGFVKYNTIDKLKHHPYREMHQKEYFRLLTSGFVHADWMHLIINMYVFFSFGQAIEDYLMDAYGSPKGQIYFMIMYLLNIIIANLPTAFQHQHNPGFASIGASGAVSGFVFMFILLAPWAKLYLMFVLPVPAIVLGVGYLIYSSWASRKGHGNIDHSAHFAGALAGMAMFILLNKGVLGEFFEKLLNP